VGVHELRHTAAALMIDQGAHILSVQRRMGYKEVRTSLDLYGHLYPEQEVTLTRKLDQVRAYVEQKLVKPG